MELSLEEAVDVMLELLGCGVIVGIFQLFTHSDILVQLMERVVALWS